MRFHRRCNMSACTYRTPGNQDFRECLRNNNKSTEKASQEQVKGIGTGWQSLQDDTFSFTER